MPARGDDRRSPRSPGGGGGGGSRPKSSPPKGGYGGSPGGYGGSPGGYGGSPGGYGGSPDRRASGQRSPGGYSQGSRGSATERRDRGARTPDSQGSGGYGRQPRPKSADGSFRGSYGGGSPSSYDGFPPRDRNQFAMNSPVDSRLPDGRLLSGSAPDGMLHHPRCGNSRTQFGGIWEDHKTSEGPIKSNTRTGFSEFGDAEATENSTYAHHFGFWFDGGDTMSHQKPNMVGTSTNVRAVNGYGRNINGGYFMREKLGEMKRYKHADSWRGMPAWARKQPEPTRPGPGYTRTDQGGYFRT